MDLINEAEIRDTWSPIIEAATGITESAKLGWMSQYCHNHKLYEDATVLSLGTTSMNLHGMGATTLGTANTASSLGSGDKAPSLLPLAMQVAAQTIGLDLVPVVPMAGPMGLLSYLDFTYQDGKLGSAGNAASLYIKITHSDFESGKTAADYTTIATSEAGSPAADTSTSYTYIGQSRIDGQPIYKVVGTIVAATILADLTLALADGANVIIKTSGGATFSVSLVASMEDHLTGFSGTSDTAAVPYSRDAGESTPDKVMGLTLFSKTIAAKTFQVAAAVTREQVQDLKQFGVDAVAQVETVLTNELTQSINSLILNKINTLGATNLTNSGLSASFNLALGTGAGGGSTPASQNRRLLTLILSAANLIANRGRRGAGNFAVVSGLVASLLQSVAGYQPAPIANTLNQNAGGIYPVGSVAGVTVYTDPNLSFSSLVISVGRKGDGNGAGLVFMPYLMAESVQTIAEGTMAPKVAVKSRFALVEAGHNPETQYVTFTISGHTA